MLAMSLNWPDRARDQHINSVELPTQISKEIKLNLDLNETDLRSQVHRLVPIDKEALRKQIFLLFLRQEPLRTRRTIRCESLSREV